MDLTRCNPRQVLSSSHFRYQAPPIKQRPQTF